MNGLRRTAQSKQQLLKDVEKQELGPSEVNLVMMMW